MKGEKDSDEYQGRCRCRQMAGEFRHMWNYIGYDEINYTTVPDGEKTLEKFMI